MTYVLERIVNDEFIFIERSEYPEWIYKDYILGKEISENFEFTLFNDDPKKMIGDIIGGISPFTIVSSKFKEILESISESELKFYPAKLKHTFNSEIENVWVLQVLNIIDAFDWENSKYNAVIWDDEKDDFITLNNTKISNYDAEILESITLKKIYQLSLKDEVLISSPHIFRIKKRASLIFIDDIIKKVINKHKLIGVNTILVENYYEI